VKLKIAPKGVVNTIARTLAVYKMTAYCIYLSFNSPSSISNSTYGRNVKAEIAVTAPFGIEQIATKRNSFGR